MGMDGWQPEAFQANEFLDWLLTPEQPRPFRTIAERDDAIRDEVLSHFGPEGTMDKFAFYRRMERRERMYGLGLVYVMSGDDEPPIAQRNAVYAQPAQWQDLGQFIGLGRVV